MSVLWQDSGWAEQVQHMATDHFLLLCGALVLVCAASLFFLFRSLFRIRIIEDTPTSRVRSAAQGYVELIGVARMMEGVRIVAPLTTIPCTWFSYKVEERQRNYDRDGEHVQWRTIDSGTSDGLFLLEDETGECVIDPDGADVTVLHGDSWYGDSLHSSVRSGGALSGLLGGGRYRFTEKRMLPGDPLYAIGLFRSVGGSEEVPDTNADVRELLAQWKRDYPQLLARFDRNGDGQIDPEEWDGARREARKEVLDAQAQRAASPAVNLLAKPQYGRRPYILSCLPQEGLTRRLRLYAALSLLGFFGCGGAAAWVILVRSTL